MNETVEFCKWKITLKSHEILNSTYAHYYNTIVKLLFYNCFFPDKPNKRCPVLFCVSSTTFFMGFWSQTLLELESIWRLLILLPSHELIRFKDEQINKTLDLNSGIVIITMILKFRIYHIITKLLSVFFALLLWLATVYVCMCSCEYVCVYIYCCTNPKWRNQSSRISKTTHKHTDTEYEINFF